MILCHPWFCIGRVTLLPLCLNDSNPLLWFEFLIDSNLTFCVMIWILYINLRIRTFPINTHTLSLSHYSFSISHLYYSLFCSLSFSLSCISFSITLSLSLLHYFSHHCLSLSLSLSCNTLSLSFLHSPTLSHLGKSTSLRDLRWEPCWKLHNHSSLRQISKSNLPRNCHLSKTPLLRKLTHASSL